MRIPMVDLVAQYRDLQPQLEPAFLSALNAAQFILGPNVQAFEKEAAAYLGVKHAITCANGTDALHLALLAADIGPGDEVITSPFTFIATAEAIAYVGAKAVFVDIDPRTFNIDVGQARRAITPKTKALLPVHLFGQPADLTPLLALAKAHQLHLVEDCAQSFGADIQGVKTGAMGDVAAFSFFPSKNLGCYGDGGMVTTQSDEMAEKLRMLRNHGSKVRYYHDIVGYNSRLDELQAVVLRAKMPFIDRYNQERRRVAHRYSAGLADLNVQTPLEDGVGLHVYHQYTLLSDDREAIQKALTDQQIASAIYYPVPLHQQKVFAAISAGAHFPVTESVAQRCLSLPIYPELSNDAVDEVCAVIRQALKAR
jgi:dTDP-4-amino-4,6-dideoxygalactose transaminase